MNRVFRDSLRSDYSVLLQCPFLPRTRVVSVIREEFGSKAVKREDLQQIIEEQWTEVGLVLNCYVDTQGQALSVQPIQVSLFPLVSRRNHLQNGTWLD